MDKLGSKEYDFKQIPFDDIVRLGQRTMLYGDMFTVSWLLGRFCNYSCSYCWPYASSRIKDHRPTSLLISTLDEIKRQARERGFNSFHFSFSGGEPTLHKGYLELLKHYSDDLENSNYQSVHMTSNISPSIKWFSKYVEATKSLHRTSITASFHKEFAERIEFCDKLVFLQEHDVQITINMVMVPEKFNVLWEDAMYFHDRGVNVTLKPQSDENAARVVDNYEPWMLEKLRTGLMQMDYTGQKVKKVGKKSTRPPSELHFRDMIQKQPTMQVELADKNGKKWFIDQAERFNAFNFNKFKNWECSSGYRSIIIREPDGFIKRSYSCSDKPLGHIETGFKLFDSVKPCITNSCVSSADSKIPKRKQGCDLPLWNTKGV